MHGNDKSLSLCNSLPTVGEKPLHISSVVLIGFFS